MTVRSITRLPRSFTCKFADLSFGAALTRIEGDGAIRVLLPDLSLGAMVALIEEHGATCVLLPDQSLGVTVALRDGDCAS